MNPARAGSVPHAVAAVRDDGSVGSGAKNGTEPLTIDDLAMTFDDLPDETTWKYLEVQGILPTFNGGKSAPWLGGPACEPKLLFEVPDPEEELAHDKEPATRSSDSRSRRSRKERDREDTSSAAPPEKKRRMTNTSMSAAADLLPVLETSGTAAKVDTIVEEPQKEDAENVEDDQGNIQMDVDPAAPRPGENGTPASDKAAEGAAMTEGTAGAVLPDYNRGATTDAAGNLPAGPTKAEDEVIIPPESPPALRRSSRRPAPLGTSLSAIHRATRSTSPTPSNSSVDSEEAERRRFKPILADLETVKQMLRDRASQDWLDSLRHKGHYSNLPGGGMPMSGREGICMVGGRGAQTKEAEAIEDFLYAIKVGDHELKIANQLPMTEL